MKIKVFSGECVGITPILWNRMKRELMLEQKKLKKDQMDEWETKNWKRKAEFDTKGNVLLPPEWLKGALVNACKKTRIVPHFATSKNQTYTSYVESFMVEILKPVGKTNKLTDFGQYVNGRGGLGSANTKVWKVRPMLNKWNFSFKIKDLEGRMTMQEFKDLLGYAGFMIGIGDNRKNNFGRFEIKSVNESEEILNA